MKSLCLAALLAALVTGCTTTWPAADKSANNPDRQAVQPTTAGARDQQAMPGAQPAGEPQPKPQKLIVRTDYPDTRLILPWFLSGPIDYVNSH